MEKPPLRNQKGLLIALGAVVGIAGGLAGASSLAQRARMRHPHDDAPGRTARRSRFGGYAVTGKTVTIARPRHELYAFWRDFQNLPKFMENLESVRPTGPDRAVWTIAAPKGRTVDVETSIAEETENEIIAWRSIDGSDIDTEGRVTFREAPGDRGTHVELVVAWKPPGGEVGRMAAKLFRREPHVQARHDLKRFKMLMETGEIATSAHTSEKEG
jgi:uncharacterized membrane protein|tara:strand:+ start:20757 stop:21401 length:645 start_codon:yes stop_codon:yes gene_type:complete